MDIVVSQLRNAQNTPRKLLLANLSCEALSLLYGHLEEREYSERTVLWDVGAPARQIFFPGSGLISNLIPTGDGKAIEVATIGREGAAGVQAAFSPLPVLTQAAIQVPGRFVVVSTEAFATCMNQNEEIRRATELCKAWLLLQSQRIAACNSAHQVEARFCRWLGEACPTRRLREPLSAPTEP